jgi:hypothetical protein
VAAPTRAAASADAVLAPTPGSSSARAAAAAAAVLHLDLLAGRHEFAAASDVAATAPIFTAQSWLPPAPPPSPVQAVAPEVPPFPYPYLGGLTDDAGRMAFFSRGDRVLAVRSGATVDGSFHVDHLDETSMTLTYLPLQKTLAVELGSRP